mmetsp:Transcript_9553/g.20270  ORF Transcript_9553/g.20270 Transcript_9553/m.20270 type:complete len:81 (-) Transcript_9553:2237-2479(-)
MFLPVTRIRTNNAPTFSSYKSNDPSTCFLPGITEESSSSFWGSRLKLTIIVCIGICFDETIPKKHNDYRYKELFYVIFEK